MVSNHSRIYYGAIIAASLIGTTIIGYSWLGLNKASASDHPHKHPSPSSHTPDLNIPVQTPQKWSTWQITMNATGIAPYTNESPVLTEAHNDHTYIRVLADPNYIADGMVILEKIMYAPDSNTGEFSLTRIYRQIPVNTVDARNPGSLLEQSTKNMPLLREDPIRMERATFNNQGSMIQIDRFRDTYYSPDAPRELPSHEIVTKGSEEHRYYGDKDQNMPTGLATRTFIITNGKKILTSESYFSVAANGQSYQSKLLLFAMSGEVKEISFPPPISAPTPLQHQNGGR